MAIRMAIELGLHEELDDESDNDTPEKLENQESRRRLFWSVYMIDKISSAATGRPSVIQDRSCSVFLPSKLVGSNGDQYYSENLDGSRSAIFNVNGLQRSYLLGAGSMSTISPNSDMKSSNLNRRYHLDCFTYVIRATSLLGGVTDYINRKGKNIETSLPPYHPDAEFNKLDKAINDWYDQLPMHLKNTPANFEMYKNSKSCYDTHHFFLLHILQNTVIVLLHRPSLTMSDTLDNETVQPELKSFIRKSVDKCMAAVDNVTVMLKGLDNNDLLPPYSTYFAYTVATVVVSASFSPHPEEAQKAKQALGVYFRVLLSARNLWAMADKLYFMIRDLYSIHSNVMRKNEIDNNIQTSQEPTETTQPDIQPAVQLTELPIQSTTTLPYPPLQMQQNIQHTIDPFGLPPMENINNSISDWTLPYYNNAMSSTTPHVGFAGNEGQNIDFLTNVFQLPQGYDQPLLFPAYDPSVNCNMDNRKNL
ncbi:MAG: hypothetical protein EXX96DRAFT_594888 [Benjaminiella poitrasii]|nr:MAG: hypothetical protein EXX96DRAFT_594888 [Benjaminiella poitrasii]